MAAGILATELRPRQRAVPQWAVGFAGSLLIVAALNVRTDGQLLAVLAGLGASLIGWALWSTEARRLLAFVGLNVGLAIVIWCASTERQELLVEVVGDQVHATLGPTRLVASVGPHSGGGVRVALAAADERPLVGRWAYDGLPLLERAAVWLAGNLRAGVDRLGVTGVDGTPLAEPSGTIWQASSAAEPPSATAAPALNLEQDDRGRHLVAAGKPTWRDYRVSAQLVRPSSTVEVIVRSDSPANGIAVVVAPDQRTLSIEERVAGQPSRPLAGGLFAYKRDVAGWCWALARELARPWLFALGLLGLVGILRGGTRTRLVRGGPSRFRISAVCGVLASATLVATAAIAVAVLEAIPHVQDDVTYLFQAQLFAVGRLAAPAPPLPEFFEQEFVLVHNGQWFGKYPPGQPLLLSLGVLAGVPWLVSPIAAAGAVVLTILAGQRLYGTGVAALAGILMLTSPFFLFMSGTMMAHPGGLLWASLLLYSTVLGCQTPRLWPWLAAGIAFGFMLITRQLSAVAIGGPMIAALAAAGLGAPRMLPARAALLGVGAAPPIVFLLFFNWRLVGDPLQNPYELWWSFDRLGFGPTIGMHGGHDVANGLANTWANTTELMRHLYGWPVYLTLAPAMIPLLTLSRRAWDWLLAASVACLILAYVAHWADGIMYGPRYYYEALGALVLLSARGFAILASAPVGEVSGTTSAPMRTHLATGLVAALLAGLLAANLVGYLPPMLAAHRGYNGVSRAGLELVERSNLDRAVVFVTQEWPHWQPYGSVFPANGPLLDRGVIFARDLGDRENRRLMAVYPDRRVYRLNGLALEELST